MNTSSEVIEISKNRTYIEPKAQLMPGITHIGRLDFSSAGQALEPHTHNGAVEFCYIERGIAVFQSGKQKWQINGGQCFVSYAEELHGTGSHPLERMKLFWIGYNTNELSSWLAADSPEKERRSFARAIGQTLPRTFGGSRKMGAAISTAIDAYLGNSPYKTLEIKTALLNLFLHLADKKSKPPIITTEIQTIIDHINSSPERNIKLSEFADLCGLSLSRFKTRFKSETGIPPGEFILRRKINHACFLLSQGISILDVSLQCGFSSSQYFATVFRKYMNKSPTEWIRSREV